MKKYITLIMLLVIITSGCEVKDINTVQETMYNNITQKKTPIEPDIDKKDCIVYNDDLAVELFKDVYRFSNLQNHEVYRCEDTFYVELEFDENVNSLEISNSRIYVMQLFVMKAEMKMTPLPYQNILQDNINWDKVVFSINLNDTVILQETFSNLNNGNFKVNYYENTDIEITSRKIKSEETEKFANKINKSFRDIEHVIFEELFRNDTLVIKLKGSKEYDADNISKIKKIVHEKIFDTEYSWVILQLYIKDKNHYEQIYDMKNKKWISEDLPKQF